MLMRTLVMVWFLTSAIALAATDIRLEQIIFREDPAFQCERANLAVHRDGRVYVSSGSTPSVLIHLDASGGGNLPKHNGSVPPSECQVVRVDLWEQWEKPTHIRGLRFGTIVGPAAYDKIRLGRSRADLENKE